jgi:predicted MPP superfamily phosphohydrolase
MKLLAAAGPDLLLMGGDYVCESPRYIAEAAAVLGEYALSARLGTLAVLGNHDYSNDASRIAAKLESRGIRVLRNDAVNVLGNESPLWIAGIDDAILGRPDPLAAFAQVPDLSPVVVLWHEPDWAEQSAGQGAILQLSGHSHGGQVRLPGLGDMAAPAGGRRFVSGRNTANGMPVYTSRGIGVYRPPVRFRCPPEVTLMTLS